MNAIKQITDILRSVGAQPETITRPDGETVIKINAPQIKKRGERKKCVIFSDIII